MKKGEMSWPRELFACVAGMWRTGLSASEIAAKIRWEKSSSAIVGMMNRHGVKTPALAKRSRQVATPKPAASSIAVAGTTQSHRPRRNFRAGNGARPEPRFQAHFAPAPIMLPSVPGQLDISLADLEADMCRWPSGADQYRFCGAPAEPGRCYCSYHDQAKTARGMARIKAKLSATRKMRQPIPQPQSQPQEK